MEEGEDAAGPFILPPSALKWKIDAQNWDGPSTYAHAHARFHTGRSPFQRTRRFSLPNFHVGRLAWALQNEEESNSPLFVCSFPGVPQGGINAAPSKQNLISVEAPEVSHHFSFDASDSLLPPSQVL